MTNKVEKYQGDDRKSKKKEIVQPPEPSIGFWEKHPFVWLLFRVLVVGLFLYTANGLVPIWVAIPLTLFAVVFFAYNEFSKNRQYLSKPHYWVGISVVVILFCVLSYQLYTLSKGSPTQQTVQSKDSHTITEPEFHVSSNEFYVDIGSVTFPFTKTALLGSPKTPFDLGETLPMKIYLDEGGRLTISADLWNGFRNPPLRLIGNAVPNLPSGWDWNFLKDRAIEIVNEDTIPIYQFVRTQENQFRVRGLFSSPAGDAVLATDHGLLFAYPVPADGSQPYLHLRRIFKYPAWKHKGESAIQAELEQDEIKYAQKNQRKIDHKIAQKTLRQFRKYTVYIANVGDYESKTFTEDVRSVFKSSGWNLKELRDIPGVGPELTKYLDSRYFSEGIEIGRSVGYSAYEENRIAADSIAALFNRNRIFATIMPALGELPPRSICFKVGFNPSPEYTKTMQEVVEYAKRPLPTKAQATKRTR